MSLGISRNKIDEIITQKTDKKNKAEEYDCQKPKIVEIDEKQEKFIIRKEEQHISQQQKEDQRQNKPKGELLKEQLVLI